MTDMTEEVEQDWGYAPEDGMATFPNGVRVAFSKGDALSFPPGSKITFDGPVKEEVELNERQLSARYAVNAIKNSGYDPVHYLPSLGMKRGTFENGLPKNWTINDAYWHESFGGKAALHMPERSDDVYIFGILSEELSKESKASVGLYALDCGEAANPVHTHAEAEEFSFEPLFSPEYLGVVSDPVKASYGMVPVSDGLADDTAALQGKTLHINGQAVDMAIFDEAKELTEKTAFEALAEVARIAKEENIKINVAMKDSICRDEEVTLTVRPDTPWLDQRDMVDADYDAVHFQDCSAEEAAFKRKDDAKKLKAVAEEVTKGLAREATMHRLCNMPDTQFAEQLGLNQFLPND